MRKGVLLKRWFLLLALLLSGPLAHAQLSPVSREITAFYNPAGSAGVLLPDAFSREFTVVNGSLSGTFIPDAFSREFTVVNGSLSGTFIPDAVSREFTLFNGPVSGTFNPDAISREITVANAAANEVDFREPDTQITSGPADDTCLSTFPITFDWTGSDDSTPISLLQYSYRTDGGPWSDWTLSTTVAIPQPADGTHVFQVRARDLSGNVDSSPAVRTFRVFTVPFAVNSWAAAPSQTTADVTWTTTRPATAKVEYGLTTAYGQATTPTATVDIAHHVTLTGLKPGTTYHYQVVSTDECGNTAVSPDTVFTTPPDTEAPDTALISGPEQNATVCTASASFCFAGTDDITPAGSLAFRWRLDGGDWQGPSTERCITLPDLGDGTHVFEVAAIDESGNADPTPATRAFNVDAGALAVTDVAASSDRTSARITWKTNRAASSKVEYGLTAAYDAASPLDNGLVATHSVTLNELTPGTSYHFRVSSTDACGNTAVSADFTFQTQAEPRDDTPPDTSITVGPAQGSIVRVSATEIRFTGIDDVTPPAELQYQWRLDGGNWSAPDRNTSASLSHLADGTHRFEVAAIDASGNVDPTPATRSFVVDTAPTPDTTPPDTSITDGPAEGALVCQRSVAFAFTGTDDATPTPALRFHWRLDNAAWQGPISATSAAFSDLSDGAHQFEVAAVDEAGNVDPTPSARSFTVDGLALTVANARATEITTTGAAILWETNKPASSQVEYRQATDTEWQRTTLDPTRTTNHRVSLTGLSADTSYVFRALSRDACDTAASPEVSFRTPSPPPPPDLIVRIVQASDQVMAGLPFSVSWVDRNGGAGSASGTWIDRIYLSADEQLDPSTDALIGEAAYGSGLNAGQEATQSASVTAPFNTTPGRYFLLVVVDAASAVPESNEDNNGKTRAITVEAFRDTTPPDTRIVSGPPDNGKACATTVEFCWTATDDATPTGQLQYSYKLDGMEWSPWGTETCHTFRDLAEGLHSLQVRARDASGNLETSPAARSFFVNLAALTIANIGVDARDYRATITWTTSKPATSQVEYGQTDAYGSVTPLDSRTDGAHEVTIYNLQPQTTYHYRVRSNDGCSEVASEDRSFTTTEIMLPDLAVRSLRFPGSVTPLSTFDVSWTIDNVGPGDAAGIWTDSLYLSQDNVLDAGDTLLGTFDRPTPLDRNTSYDQTRSIQIPRLPPSGRYLILKIDGGNTLTEGREDNNILALSLGILKIQSLVAAPSPVAHTLVPGQPVQGQLDLTNLDDEVLRDITATVEGAPANIAVQIDAPAVLAAMETGKVSYTVTATNDSILQSAPILRFRGGGEETTVPLSLTVAPLRPNLVATPGALDTGMVRGKQTLVEFTITNTGSAAATDLRVSLPSAPWMSLVTPESVGDLAPGETAKITLALMPAANLPLGPYTGTIAINGQNAVLQVSFTFRCISEDKGALTILSEDEFTYFSDEHPPVVGAKVVLKDPYTDAVVLEGVTNDRGRFTRQGIFEGVYNLEVTADGHRAHRSGVEVVAGEERQARAFLQRDLVTYRWSVTPISVEDQYAVRLEAVFETHVPAPVVTLSPKLLDLSKVSFDASGKAVVYYTITNHGLIAADDVTFTFPDDPDYQITPAIESLGTLKPLSTIVVPVIIERGAPASRASRTSGIQAEIDDNWVSCFINGLLHFKYLCDVIRSNFDDAVISKPPQVGGCSTNLWIPTLFDPHPDPGPGPEPVPNPGPGPAPNPYTPGVEGPRELVLPIACDRCFWESLGKFTLCWVPVPGAGVVKCTLTSIKSVYGVYSSCSPYKPDLVYFAKCFSSVTSGAVSVLKGCGAELPKESFFWFKLFSGIKCIDTFINACPPIIIQPGQPSLTSLAAGARIESPEVAFLKIQSERLQIFAAAFIALFGDQKWLNGDEDDQTSIEPLIDEIQKAIDPVGEGEERILPSEETRLLSAPLPRPLTAADVLKFVARWNRTLDYYRAGIFTLADLPPGQNTDFIDFDVLLNRWRAADGAADAAIAEGNTGIFEGVQKAVDRIKEKFLTPQDEGVCAKVRVRLDQNVALTRSAFQATLEISNAPESVTLENVRAVLNIRDVQGNDATSLFAIGAPVLTGIERIEGGGSVAPGVTASAQWKILPTREAAPEGNTQYLVSGTLSYVQNGIEVSIPLFPTGILVKPDPFLQLHYFWQRDVYGDDPFTPEIEPAEPFTLGLLVVNAGRGGARNMTIETAQPEIVDNQKGLLVDFKIIGTQVNDQEINPGLKVNLGDIPAGEASVARWVMNSTLQGKFLRYSAEYRHIDGLGNTRTSLIDSVRIHELEHAVRLDIPADDKKPDFLANDVPDSDSLPETLYQSDGTIAPVTPLVNASVDRPVSDVYLQVTLSAPSAPPGLIYIRTDDPAQGRYRLLRVIRSDGRQIRLEDNAWTTHRTIRQEGQAAVRQHRLHLFDRDSTGSYTLIYEQLTPAEGPINRLKTLPDGRQVAFGSDPNADDGGGSGNGNGGGNGGSGNGDGSGSGDGAVPSGPVVVSAAFPDSMYIEALDRSGGIKVVPSSQPEGVLVMGTGILRTGANGERYIEATSMRAVGAGSVAPLGIATKPLYSGGFFYNPETGAGQKGMAGGAGLNTVGLLVQTLGRVVGVGGSAFLIDDGYGRSVRALLPAGVPPPSADSFVIVTGAVSTEKTGGDLYPVIRARRAADVLHNQDALRQTFTTPSGTLNAGWNLFSLPGIPAEPAPTAVLNPLDGSGLQGRLSRYDAPTQSEVFFNAAAPGLFGNLLLGEGYRLRLDAGESTEFGLSGFRSDFADRWLSLPRIGAARIGHPFPYAVPWVQVQVTDGMKTVPMRQAARVEFPNWLNSVAEYFDSAGQVSRFLGLPEDAVDSTSLLPWRGYWVTGNRDNLALIVPAQISAPLITSLEPASTTAGGPAFPLTVRGSGFVSASTVQWNGQARPTAFLSANELTAQIPASDIAAEGSAQVTVVNPVTEGGSSGPATFLIAAAPRRDTTPPTSSVSPLLALTSDPIFTVSWSGQDEEGGSGLASFDIYVSDNNGAYTRWQSAVTTTSATFTGRGGHTYRFYSIARDNAGNVEAAPLTPDATTVVTSPVPQITGLSPTAAVVGGPAFTLTVDGSGFVEGSLLRWNGLPRQTTFVSGTQLRAAIPAGDLSVAGKAQISVVTPAPGGGSSNGVLFSVGKVALRVTATLSRQGGEIVATVTLANTGTAPAQNLQVTVARMGTVGTGSALPVVVGEVGVGASQSVQLRFTAPPAGGSTTLSVNGIYTGGTFNSASRVTVP